VEAVRAALGVPVGAHPETARRLAERGLRVDRELSDGERIVLAGDPPFPVRAIHTPGHARGHLCFYDETGGSLLAGDMVAGVGTIVIDPPEGDMDAYLASLEKLGALAPSTLFPAHGPPIADAPGKLREYVAHRLWREERILEAWRSGVREPRAMLPTVYDDAPERAWPLAERQIVAHLERLARAGRIE
jgi:glyoxylase-like metal-dependent hydrolase (beta-lactamase superfamily II)